MNATRTTEDMLAWLEPSDDELQKLEELDTVGSGEFASQPPELKLRFLRGQASSQQRPGLMRSILQLAKWTLKPQGQCCEPT